MLNAAAVRFAVHFAPVRRGQAHIECICTFQNTYSLRFLSRLLAIADGFFDVDGSMRNCVHAANLR